MYLLAYFGEPDPEVEEDKGSDVPIYKAGKDLQLSSGPQFPNCRCGEFKEDVQNSFIPHDKITDILNQENITIGMKRNWTVF